MRVYLLRHGGRLFFAHDHATALIFSTSKGLLLEPPSLNSSLTLFLRQQWNYIPLNLFSTCLTYKLGCSKNLIFDCQLLLCHLNFCEINLVRPHDLVAKTNSFRSQNTNAFSIKVGTKISWFEPPIWEIPCPKSVSFESHRPQML